MPVENMLAGNVPVGNVLAENELHVRWLGRCSYEDVWALQNALYAGDKNYLLLVEHPAVYTLGVRGKKEHLLKGEPLEMGAEISEMGADVIWVDRGGDVTFHGPGQLVGYPILSLAAGKGGLVHTARYVQELEALLKEIIEVELGFGFGGDLFTKEHFPGLWVGDEEVRGEEVHAEKKTGEEKLGEEKITGRKTAAKKIASIGVKLNRGRTMHGFALNISTDLSWFDNIVPCGLKNISMTSLREQNLLGGDDKWGEDKSGGKSALGKLSMPKVAEAVARVAVRRWTNSSTSTHTATSVSNITQAFDTKISSLELESSTQTPISISSTQTPTLKLNARKPDWLRAPVTYTPTQFKLKKILKDLPTVCEEAGCPNLSECWGEGTATFMINGDRCTRNCGFCLVDTQKPLALDEMEPERLAQAVQNIGLNNVALKHVVITAVARDDLADGGAGAFVKTIRAVRSRCPDVSVEVLIPDFKGRAELLDMVFDEQPEVLNHNLETCLRLQKRVRPQAGYARSLSVLARAKAAGLTTKSSLMMGLGETVDEIKAALTDLGQVKTDIVTIGQYLRPSQRHLPVSRWIEPEEFEELASMAGIFNIGHIEAGPLVRSSYRAGKIQSELIGASMGSKRHTLTTH